LIELLVAMLISALIGAAMTTLVQAACGGRATVLGEESALQAARLTLETLSDDLRNAQPYPGGTGGQYEVLQGACPSAFIIYLDGSGDTASYYIDGTQTPPALVVKRTISGTATVTTLVRGISLVSLTYYVSSGGAYNGASTSWTTTANPNAPTAAELPNIGAIYIVAGVSVGGYVRTMSTTVRLRNGPYNGLTG
jgi:type II secretory pathway pseudopilin PulG